MNRFVDKVAIVTGGTRGIGKEIARLLATEGAKIIIIGRNEESAAAAANELHDATQGQVIAIAGDVAQQETADRAVACCMEKFGKLDILVNNAGITRDNLLLRMREEEWDSVIQTNLKSIFNMCKAAIRPMMKAHYGRIVNISSVSGLHGNAGQVNYAAAKAGIIGFSKSLAKEIASRNITVNVVAPGVINTEMTADMPQDALEKIVAAVPLARMGMPADVAEAAAFLASDSAAYITGHTLEVDGGLCI